MAGETVPASDLPGSAVPANDLPSASPAANGTPVTGTPEDDSYFTGALSPAAGMEAGASVLSGMVAQPVGGLVGLAGAALPGPSGQGARVSERVSNALTYNPRSKGGQNLTSVLGIPAAAISTLADKVGDRGSEVSPVLGTIGKTSVEALLPLLGARAGMRAPKPLTAAQERAGQAMDAGYRLTPQEMEAGPVAKTAASLAGEPRLAKVNAGKNQPLIVERTKAELGMPPNQELNIDSLGAVRKEAHKEYEAIRQAGDIPTDSAYMAEADKLGEQYRSAAKSFPKLAKKDVENLTDALKVEKFSSSEAIDQIQILRQDADEYFRKGETRLAKANRAAADMIEAQIGRHLEVTGREDLLANFQKARERIAKSYAVQKAVVGDDAINPQALGKQVRQGKPLTGDLKGIGKFANDFERSGQKPTHQATGATIHDAALALLNAVRTGGGSALMDILSIFARPTARSFMSSRAGQKLMDPRTNLHTMEALGTSGIPRPAQEEKR